MSAETNENTVVTIGQQYSSNQNNQRQPQPQSPTRQVNMNAGSGGGGGNGGTVVGLGAGKLTCNIHEGFETYDINEFNNHCSTTDGHFIVGQKGCATCNNIIDIPEDQGGIPHSAADNLQCPECFQKQQNTHQNLAANGKLRLRRAVNQGGQQTQQGQSQQTNNNNNQQGQGQ
jgi:hypothetical protein